MGWPSSLTYRQLVARNVPRSVEILACYGDVETAAPLFAADPRLADDPPALRSAADAGHAAFVHLMLRYQPDLPRRIATVARTRELTELLFRHGMDPNHATWLRITRLHDFAQRGNVEAAAIFIDRGADLHARDEELRSTPLGHAARAGHATMVEFLLRRGAKPTLPDDPPWATPLAWATRRRHDAIVRLLEEYERTGTLPAQGIAHYEGLAADLVEACRSGEHDAFERMLDHFNVRRPLTWNRPDPVERVRRLRRYTRERLGLSGDDEAARQPLPLEDARLLIARSHGFEDWSALAAHARG